jgi:hypothetical protein
MSAALEATPSPTGTAPGSKTDLRAGAEESGMSLSAFARQLVEIQNSIIGWWERREKEERAAFKAQEDARWKERKEALHTQTHDAELNAKRQKELVTEDRLKDHSGWKEEEADRMVMIAQRREEWTQDAKGLVSKHGKEQAAKNKESLRQNAETKVSAHAAHIPTETQQSSLLSPVAPSCDYPATSCVYS